MCSLNYVQNSLKQNIPKQNTALTLHHVSQLNPIKSRYICRSVERYSSQYENDSYASHTVADRLVGDATRLQHELHFCLNACCTCTWQSIPGASSRATCHPSTSKPSPPSKSDQPPTSSPTVSVGVHPCHSASLRFVQTEFVISFFCV